MASKLLTGFLVVGVLTGIGIYLCPCLLKQHPVPKVDDFRWWGRGNAPPGAEKLPIVPKSFKIHVEDADLEDLKERLSVTRYSEPLEDVKSFDYGMPGDRLQKVVEYWTEKYDWRKQEAALNKFNHFKANIEGIDVHYIHAKPTTKDKAVKVLPIMLIHGWPGSVVEFLKIIPLLTTPKDGYAFEVFCPSIPGYGYSEAPHKQGFNAAEAARIFHKLMSHFHSQYYVQGGDWGSFIAQNMAILYPQSIRGMHINMPLLAEGFSTFKMLVGAYFPNLFFEKEEAALIYPLKKTFSRLILETGYMHIQATKPDTVGSALGDSPAGLAAYILEKFSTWTVDNFRDLPDGGLEKKFTLDELLTNVMVYWTTNSITSSQRFYKENFKPDFFSGSGFQEAPIKVPTGISSFPNDLVVLPKALLTGKYPNIVTYALQPRGGHFAAFEEPLLLEKDVRHFVDKTEEKIQNQKIKSQKEQKTKK